MAKTDSNTSLQDLKDLVSQFRDERNWNANCSSKNLAMSIAIEAAELMELYQWDDYGKGDVKKAADELADILIYCMNFAETNGIDISTAFHDKLARAKQKYPTEVFNATRNSTDDYHRIKQAYRENSTS